MGMINQCPVCGAKDTSCFGGSPSHPPIDLPSVVPAGNRAMYVALETVYLNEQGKVVGPKDPSRLTLLVRAGGLLPRSEAIRYGLLADEEGAEPAFASGGISEAQDAGEQLRQGSGEKASMPKRTTRRRPYAD